MSEMTHKAGRAAFGKAIDIAMKNADKNWEKEVVRLLDLSENYMKGEKLDVDYEKARKMVCDRDGALNKYISRILAEVDPHVLKATALNLGFEAFFHGTKTIRKMRVTHQCLQPALYRVLGGGIRKSSEPDLRGNGQRYQPGQGAGDLLLYVHRRRAPCKEIRYTKAL